MMSLRNSPAKRLSMMPRDRRPAFVQRLYLFNLADVMRSGTISNHEAQAVARNRVSELVAEARELEKENVDV